MHSLELYKQGLELKGMCLKVVIFDDRWLVALPT